MDRKSFIRISPDIDVVLHTVTRFVTRVLLWALVSVS